MCWSVYNPPPCYNMSFLRVRTCTAPFISVSSVSNTVLNMSVQFSSVAQSCPTLCDPMNHSTPGLPVHHQLPEFTQTHVHQVGDAIQPSHPLPQNILKWRHKEWRKDQKKKKKPNFCQMPEPMWSNFPSPRQIAIGNFKALIIPWERLLFCPLQFLAPHQCRAGHADKFPKWDEFDSPWAWHLVAQVRNASYFSKQLQGRNLKLSHHPHSVEAKIHGLSPNLLPLSR